ncbi:FadR/GntR family transcriptional regulator [Salinicola salarius]|uniref:FadR/GntR family transcriptional regulator n=1 Tax=Salinicola salarius TaxID=430457 RepID=UPI000DA1B31D|nr:FadR/GntR family transcriptional regulator [Salinicola salarius]
MMTSATTRKRLLSENVAGSIFKEILSNRYPEGERLPSELELAQRLNVSRLTLREAIKHLQARGVIVIQRGNGTFVTHRAQWAMLDPLLLEVMTESDEINSLYHHLTDMRRMMETGLASLAAQRRSTEHIDRMRRALDAMHAATDTLSVRRYAAADMEFHCAILDAADNPFATSVYGQLQVLLTHVREETTRLAIGQRHGLTLHHEILEAIEAADPLAAREAIERHFDMTAKWVDMAIAAPASVSANGETR